MGMRFLVAGVFGVTVSEENERQTLPRMTVVRRTQDRIAADGERGVRRRHFGLSLPKNPETGGRADTFEIGLWNEWLSRTPPCSRSPKSKLG